MDISETYIKMCDCEEIQDEWDGSWDDFVWNGQKVVVTGYHDEDGDFLRGANPIWLPRQDQLQEMVGMKRGYLFTFLSVVRSFCAKEAELDWSMEQLWLAFVMKEKHNKIWDGEEWTLVE